MDEGYIKFNCNWIPSTVWWNSIA